MKKLRSSALVLVVILSASLHCWAADDQTANSSAAKEIWQASGGENWNNVKELRFTFVVEQDGKTLASVQHDWNVSAGTDHVQWKDKDVTVSLTNPASDEDGKAAYARWVNDSYWLLAPLKILDPGVNVNDEGMKEMDGTSSHAMHVSFGQVGLTPSDEYVFYIDPQTHLMRSWDYKPKTGQGMHATWEKYQEFGGLHLSTEHHFNDKVIRFAGIEAIASK